MKAMAYQRFLFTGQMWIPLDDPRHELPVMTLIKDVMFDFASDPTSPRQVIISPEPIPTLASITGVFDRYGNQPMPLAEWTITGVEPLMNVFRGTELYRHSAALAVPSDFGYPISRSN